MLVFVKFAKLVVIEVSSSWSGVLNKIEIEMRKMEEESMKSFIYRELEKVREGWRLVENQLHED